MITKKRIEDLGEFSKLFYETVCERFKDARFICTIENNEGTESLLVNFPDADTSAYVTEGSKSSWFSIGENGSEHITLNVPGRIIVSWGNDGSHQHFDEMTIEGTKIAMGLTGQKFSLPVSEAQWLIDGALRIVQENL